MTDKKLPQNLQDSLAIVETSILGEYGDQVLAFLDSVLSDKRADDRKLKAKIQKQLTEGIDELVVPNITESMIDAVTEAAKDIKWNVDIKHFERVAELYLDAYEDAMSQVQDAGYNNILMGIPSYNDSMFLIKFSDKPKTDNDKAKAAQFFKSFNGSTYALKERNVKIFTDVYDGIDGLYIKIWRQ